MCRLRASCAFGLVDSHWCAFVRLLSACSVENCDCINLCVVNRCAVLTCRETVV